MSSGVQAKDECKTVFDKMKIGKERPGHILFHIVDDKYIEPKSTGEAGALNDSTFGQFVAGLVKEYEHDPLYVCMDVEYDTKSGAKNSKIVFVKWVPDTAKIRTKMLYASSCDALKKTLGSGIAKEMQASEGADLDYKEIATSLAR